MIFAEFYHESTGWNGKDFSGPVKLIPMCGSDSVFRLDSRKSLENQIADTRKRIYALRNVQPHIKGFRIVRSNSERFSEGNHITGIIAA